MKSGFFEDVLKRAKDRLLRFGTGPTGEEVMRTMPTVLARGKSRPLGDRVLAKEWTDSKGQEWRAVLARDFHGAPSNKWLLSGYDVDEHKRGGRK